MLLLMLHFPKILFSLFVLMEVLLNIATRQMNL